MASFGDSEPPVTSPDAHVGSRVRLRRTLLGMTQERLGEVIGVTAEQVRGYEQGLGRVGLSRLRALAEVFGVPVGFFHDNQPHGDGAFALAPERDTRTGVADAQDGFGDDTSSQREIRDLLRAYNRIAEPARRRQALELVRSLALTE